MAQSYENRKPKMNEHRRKILNLLEFILEVDDNVDTVYNLFCDTLIGPVDGEDMTCITDEEWSDLLQTYADKLRRGELPYVRS